jgi:hypothetical protein
LSSPVMAPVPKPAVARFDVQPTLTSRPRKRVLPSLNERFFVTMYLSSVLDQNFRVYSLLKGRHISDLLVDALTSFLSMPCTCESAHAQAAISKQPKIRVTFVITKELQVRLNDFVQTTQCNQTCVVTAALIDYLATNKIAPYRDHAQKLLRVLTRARREVPAVRP